jgi:pantoate--beta-alanine ligase
MEIVRTIDELAAHHGGAFVPTMGALHEGHLALIRRAAALGQPVVVSIFVNPTQFGPGEDLERYPRQFEADVESAARSGGTVVFAPAVETMYPPGKVVPAPPLPAVATRPQLEDAQRPGHFKGVCQVVARLFDLVRPRWAVFGEKDYQQLRVIESMVNGERERWGRLEIVRHDTVRESDGLAMSSRNAYIGDKRRSRARGLFRALQSAHAAQRPDTAERLMRETLEAHELEVDYAAVRDAETLLPVSTFARPTRALVAARLDEVRLIDNMAMTVWT